MKGVFLAEGTSQVKTFSVKPLRGCVSAAADVISWAFQVDSVFPTCILERPDFS